MQHLFESLPASLVMLDEELRYLATTSRWRSIFGEDGEPGRVHFEVFPDEGRWQRQLSDVLEGETRRGRNAQLQRIDGTVFWVNWEARPWRDESGEVSGVLLYFDDQTEEKETLDLLRLTQSTVDRAGDAILWFRDSGEIVFANTRAEDLWGYSREEIVGMQITQLDPRARRQFWKEQWKATREQEGLTFESIHRTRDGDPLPVEVSVNYLEFEGQELNCAFVRDISARRAARKRLEESERRYRLIAENGADLIALHDDRGRYTYVSPSSHELLGYDPETLLGTALFDMVAEEDRQRVREALGSVIDTGEALRCTYRVTTADKEVLWLESTFQARKHSQAIIQSASRDVTERVHAEQALERTNKVLELRNRELQDFAYVASHDLQEPLRKIRAFGDLLLEDYGDAVEGDGAYYLDRMRDAAERMSSLISDLLSFSRVTTEANPFDEVDLEEVFEGVVSDLSVRIEEVEGTVERDALPTIEADQTQMRQLLQNLIGNALKFRREGVRPRVRVRAELGDRILPSNPTPQRVLKLMVEDNGVGFDEKYADRIFTPFQRLHGRGRFEGTGMGLAICRRIIERHHGELSVQSTPGEGSTFTIILPVEQTEPTTYPDDVNA